MLDPKLQETFDRMFPQKTMTDDERVAKWWEEKAGGPGPYCMWYTRNGERDVVYRSSVLECIQIAREANPHFHTNDIIEVETHMQFFRSNYN